jgi:hypothetical protein
MMLALLGLSLAQDTDVEAPVTYAEETYIEFGYTRVDGKLVGPDGKIVVERPKAEFNPMIKLRTDFQPEMDSSVDSVR